METPRWEEMEKNVFIAGSGNPVSLHITGSTASVTDPAMLPQYLPGTHIVSKHLFHGTQPYAPDWENVWKEHNLRLAEENDVSRIIGYSRGGIATLDVLDEYPADEAVFVHPSLKPSGSAFLKRAKPECSKGDSYENFGRFMSFLCPDMDDGRYWEFIDTHWKEYAGIDGMIVSIMKNELKGLDYGKFHRRIAQAVSETRTRVLVIAGGMDPYHLATPELRPVTRTIIGAGHYAHVSRPFDVASRINEFSLDIRNSDDDVRLRTPPAASADSGEHAAVEEESFGF